MAGTRPEVAVRLAREAKGLRDDLLAAPAIDGLAGFGRAATVSGWAAMAGRDVRELDAIVEMGVLAIRAAAESPDFPFADMTDLLDVLTFTAWSYLDRFDYRLDVHDLDEADRYAEQALTLALGDATPVPDPIWIRAQTVHARAADLRFELDGDPAHLDGAIERLESTLERDLDPVSMAALARVFRHRAAVSLPDRARVDLGKAVDLLETLLDPDGGPPEIHITPLFRAGWMAELGLVYLAAHRSSGHAPYLERARELATAGLESWPSSAEVALALADIEGTTAAYRRVWPLAATDAWCFLRASCRLARLSVGIGPPVAVGGAARSALDLLNEVLDRQAGDADKAVWLPLLTEMTALATPALAATGEVALAASYLERGRTRILQDRFPDEEHELDDLAATRHADLVSPIRRALDILRDPNASVAMRAGAGGS